MWVWNVKTSNLINSTELYADDAKQHPQNRQAVRDETAHDIFMSRVGVPLGVAVAGTPFGKMKLPMRLASKMWALVNDKKAAKVQTCPLAHLASR